MTTLESLREQARQRSDMQNSSFIEDVELNGYINASYGELYDLLVSRMEDYFIADESFTLTTGQNTRPLPSSFYKLLGVDYLLGGSSTSPISLKKFNFAERNRFHRESIPVSSFRGIPERMYRVLGENIMIMPETNAEGSYKIWFIPKVNVLVADSDELDANCDVWAEYIVVDAAIKCLIKEESDIQALMIVKQQLKARIEALASNRDAGEPERVADVSTAYDNDIIFRGGGFY